MSELSKIRKDGVDYDLKDTTARDGLKNAVKTVNGAAPDENGNVDVSTGDSIALAEVSFGVGKEISTGVQITVTKADGTTESKTVYDGKDGADGDSCSIGVEETADGYALNIYNRDGETGGESVSRVEIYHGKDSSQNANGLSQAARVAIYNLLMDAVYQSSDHTADKAALEELLTGESSGGGESVTYYTIAKTLTNVTISNGVASVAAGSAYSATLTADSGYTLDDADITVTMGGEVVAVTGGVIDIAAVTGNIEIIATATEVESLTFGVTKYLTVNGAVAYSDDGGTKLADMISSSYVYATEELPMDGEVTISFTGFGVSFSPMYGVGVEFSGDRVTALYNATQFGGDATGTQTFVVQVKAGQRVGLWSRYSDASDMVVSY